MIGRNGMVQPFPPRLEQNKVSHLILLLFWRKIMLKKQISKKYTLLKIILAGLLFYLFVPSIISFVNRNLIDPINIPQLLYTLTNEKRVEFATWEKYSPSKPEHRRVKTLIDNHLAKKGIKYEYLILFSDDLQSGSYTALYASTCYSQKHALSIDSLAGSVFEDVGNKDILSKPPLSCQEYIGF